MVKRIHRPNSKPASIRTVTGSTSGVTPNKRRCAVCGECYEMSKMTAFVSQAQSLVIYVCGICILNIPTYER